MAKKTTKTTKKSTPRATKKVEITEKQYSEAVVNETEKVSVDLNELKKYKTSENEYDMTKASSEEVTTIIDNLKDDDVVIVKKDKIVDQDPPIEVMNGDPTVVTSVDDIEEKAMAETFKENKKSNRIIDRTFGYSWNGQEIDFIL